MRRNYFIWGGVLRSPYKYHDRSSAAYTVPDCPTVVIDVDLASWALPMAIHAGGPLLGKPGFHVRIGPINIGWSKL